MSSFFFITVVAMAKKAETFLIVIVLFTATCLTFCRDKNQKPKKEKKN